MTDLEPVASIEEAVKEAVDAIRAAHSTWSEATGRTKEACYRLLAEIFVRAPSIDDDLSKKYLLVDEVRKHPDVGQSNRHDPFKSSAAELMLTLLFGLKEQRNTKSHWRSALQAAEQECRRGAFDRTREGFVGWIKQKQIHGARAIVAKRRQPFDPATLEEFIEDEPVELPISLPSDLEASSGFALVLVKLGGSTETKATTATYCGCIASTRLLEAASKALHRQQEQERRRVAEQLIHESGDPALLIPKSARAEFGRTHFTDEDERDDYFAERKSETKRTRRRLRDKPKSQWELSKRKKGQAALPELQGDGIDPVMPQESSSIDVTRPDAEDDNAHYFEALGKSANH